MPLQKRPEKYYGATIHLSTNLKIKKRILTFKSEIKLRISKNTFFKRLNHRRCTFLKSISSWFELTNTMFIILCQRNIVRMSTENNALDVSQLTLILRYTLPKTTIGGFWVNFFINAEKILHSCLSVPRDILDSLYHPLSSPMPF